MKQTTRRCQHQVVKMSISNSQNISNHTIPSYRQNERKRYYFSIPCYLFIDWHFYLHTTTFDEIVKRFQRNSIRLIRIRCVFTKVHLNFTSIFSSLLQIEKLNEQSEKKMKKAEKKYLSTQAQKTLQLTVWHILKNHFGNLLLKPFFFFCFKLLVSHIFKPLQSSHLKNPYS